MTDVLLRSAIPADWAFIVGMARHACVIEDRPLPAAGSAEVEDILPGADGISVVATTAAGTPLGAVWIYRHEPPLLVDAGGVSVPELIIAVAPGERGRGIGGGLLDELFARCAATYPALCLNVHYRNPAARLYERKGFRVAGQGRGVLGVAMRRVLR